MSWSDGPTSASSERRYSGPGNVLAHSHALISQKYALIVPVDGLKISY